MAINLVYEDVENDTNCIKGNFTTDNPNYRRFDRGNIRQWLHLLNKQWSLYDLEHKPKKYVYTIRGWSEPQFWIGFESLLPDPFTFIPETVLDDARNNNVLLVIDSFMEGPYDPRIYAWLHQNVAKYGINPSHLIFCSGSLTEADSYKKWCSFNNIWNPVTIITDSFPMRQSTTWWHDIITPSWEDLMRYKTANKDRIKFYNCLNYSPRWHREVMICQLHNHGLLDKGLVSFQNIRGLERLQSSGIPTDVVNAVSAMNGRVIDVIDNPLKTGSNFNADIYKDSCISLITETICNDGVEVFLTEKVIKPILAKQPFMIWGNCKSLEYLRSYGFKTFDGLIDESYDTLPYAERCNAIIQNLKLLESIDILEWYDSCKEICEHNYNLYKNHINDGSAQADKFEARWRQLITK